MSSQNIQKSVLETLFNIPIFPLPLVCDVESNSGFRIKIKYSRLEEICRENSEYRVDGSNPSRR
jgi:hypothetical protein